MGKPHVWVMKKGEGEAETYRAYLGIRPTIPPHCKFCGISSVEAQKTQSETKGVGPCPKR